VKKISSQSFKFILTFVIIFSNYSYGKEFQKLFEITTPMNQVSNVDAAISKSFNDLIFRLTGTNNLSTIKQIAPSVKVKKDFLISYEPINIDDQSFLVAKFNKDSLIEKLESLEIPIIGYNRPTVMMLMKIADGSQTPYILNNSSNSHVDNKIKIILNKVSNQRGIFFELPVFDLDDIKELKSLTIFDSERDIILSNYEYDFQLNLNLSQSNINKWIILGDYKSEKSLSLDLTLDNLQTSLNSLADNYLSTFIISDKESYIEVIVNNISSYDDLMKLQEVMLRLISIRTSVIESYVEDSISYTLKINGDLDSFKKEIRANPYLQLIESDENVTFVLISN
jgi:hypothetical protein